MRLEYSVALSLANLPRVGLTDRLKNDPNLIECAEAGIDHARHAIAAAARDGISVLAWNDDRFPSALAPLPDLPPALWYRGRVETFDGPAVAIVGSRAASDDALEIAARLGADLAAAGFTVVSGLARGVDSAAHRGALDAGRTIAVLGSGVDNIYPPEHTSLASLIAKDGLVVSELAPGTPPLPHHFPLRNRLISGLSLAVVVIEASEKSGSLITAACALEQGREVLAVPGNALNGRNRGGHALIRDGAKIVETADDIVREIGWTAAGVRTSVLPTSRCLEEPSGDCLLDRMVPGEPRGLDELSEVSGLDANGTLSRLLDLELRGLVRRAAGGRFVRPM